MIDRNVRNTKDECDTEFIDPIAMHIMKKYPYEKVSSRLAPANPQGWIRESLTEAQTDVFSTDLKRFEMPSKDYMKKGLKVAEERLALAGYRMGDLFNQAFGGGPMPK